MAVRILHRWHQAPPHGAIEVSPDPIARSCEFLFVGAAKKDIAFGLTPTPTGTAPPTWQATTKGIAAHHDGGGFQNSRLNFGAPANTAVGLGGRPATWVALARASQTSTVALGERSDNNSVNTGWLFGYQASAINGLGMVIERSGSNIRKVISETITANEWFTLVATYDGLTSADGLHIYLNGVLGTVGGSSPGSGTTGPDTNESIFIGAHRFYNSHSHEGDIALFGIFGRQWSSSEVAAFHRNPWILIQPKMFSIPVLQAASTRVPIWALSNSLRSRKHV